MESVLQYRLNVISLESVLHFVIMEWLYSTGLMWVYLSRVCSTVQTFFYGGCLTVQTKCDFFFMVPVSTVLGVSSSFLSLFYSIGLLWVLLSRVCSTKQIWYEFFCSFFFLEYPLNVSIFRSLFCSTNLMCVLLKFVPQFRLHVLYKQCSIVWNYKCLWNLLIILHHIHL